MDADQTITRTVTEWDEIIDKLWQEDEHPGTYRLSTGHQSRTAGLLADYLEECVGDVVASVSYDFRDAPLAVIEAETRQAPVEIGLDWDSALTVLQLSGQ